MAHLGSAETAIPQQVAADRWTAYSLTVWAICMLGFAFDIYEGTIMQLVSPILIKEWGIVPATIGYITTLSAWVGLIGVFVFPALADLYGRRPILILTILGYSLFTGFTGFAQGPLQLLIFTSITRIALRGETPVGMVMVSETAPTKWRATALGGLVGGYPFGYMLCSLTALVVVPLWGWRALYWLGILPALLVLWVRLGVRESPRFERVTTAMLKEGLRKRLDIWSPVRQYPREMLTATLLYFFYLFTWIGWSAWMPLYLANEKHLGFHTAASYLSIWMFCAIFAYYLCGWLSDVFGRRYVIPAFCIPAAILLVVMGQLDSATSLFWVGLILNFLITGSYGSGLGYNTELFPTQIRGTAVGAAFTFGSAGGALAPAIVGWIATSHSIAAALPLLAVSFFLIAPMFLFVARETTRKELTDFVGQRT
ncbi:MAG TPA: MFS transporter [Stellaceae bacterium]|jgi:MFS family permease|nr:MFS transporter [Stellaceae bacterium]